nr:MAG TPA: hypothetical protein [Caudoviricetes sp.]
MFCVSFYLDYTYIINIYDYMSIKKLIIFFKSHFFKKLLSSQTCTQAPI